VLLNTLFHSAFIFTAKRLPVPVTLLITLCRTVPSLASITRSYFYFAVPITCTVWMSPTPSTASLVRYSLYNLKRIGHKQHPCLTLLPIFTLLFSPWFSRTLTTFKLRSGKCAVLLLSCDYFLFGIMLALLTVIINVYNQEEKVLYCLLHTFCLEASCFLPAICQEWS